MSSASRPGRSTIQICRVAWRLVSPSRAIWSRIWSAMPTPAVPPPKMTTRWSRHRVPVTFSALNSPAITTAPVPCMSSLKIRYLSR